MYTKYVPTKWKEDGTLYGEKTFNNIESGIQNLEHYMKYRELQTINMGRAMKKLRTNQDVSISLRGDSVFFGYNTITSGEEGLRRYTNDVMEDRNPSEHAKELGYEGFFYYGEHPLRKLETATATAKASSEITGNGTVKRTEVQIPDVMIQCLNEVYEGHITFIDKVYTGDSCISNYLKYDASGADIEICNLGINDALASFLGAEYVGNVPEFVEWYCKIIERELDNGTAFVIMTPVLQTTVATYDIDARTTVDVYEKILYDLGRLYGIPVLNGNELSHNFNNKLIIDFTHFTCAGNESVGKRLAAPFIAGDLSNHRTVTNGSFLGIRPQEDSINVRGAACIDYSDKAPSFPALLDNNDLYDTGVSRINKGLAVYVNYPLDGEIKPLYDRSIFDNEETGEGWDTSDLWNLASNVWGLPTTTTHDETIDAIIEAQENYILNEVTEVNVLWRQADLYARGYGVRGSEEYNKAFDTRMTFLQGRHGYTDNKTGKITWAFYTDKDGMVVIPSLYADGVTITMELDFANIVPAKSGKHLTEMNLEQLQSMLCELDTEYVSSDDDTKEDLISRIIVLKGYDKAEFTQGSPSDICEWLDTDEIDYDYIEPSVKEISPNGYYSKRIARSNHPLIKITNKGWHTLTLHSDNTYGAKKDFLVFGLQFMDINDFKNLPMAEES